METNNNDNNKTTMDQVMEIMIDVLGGEIIETEGLSKEEQYQAAFDDILNIDTDTPNKNRHRACCCARFML